jgi:hypothetical protein
MSDSYLQITHSRLDTRFRNFQKNDSKCQKDYLAALLARQDSPMQIRALRYSGVRPGRHPGLESHGGGFPVCIKRGLEAPVGM